MICTDTRNHRDLASTNRDQVTLGRLTGTSRRQCKGPRCVASLVKRTARAGFLIVRVKVEVGVGLQ